MLRKSIGLLIVAFFLSTSLLYAQNDQQKSSDSIFNKWGEIYFKFNITSRAEVNSLTRIISIDNVKDNEVFAFANREEFLNFLKFNYQFTILSNPGTSINESDLLPDSLPKNGKSTTVWNFYPTYQQYVDTMLYFASTYPEICRIDTIGTTVQGRLLLALKISDSVNIEEAEPEFLYTSSMHGDETTGYVLMLHLIDSLLTGYGVSPRITRIVDGTEIYINPLANPDGTYHGGNYTVSGSVRYNANGYDLNRNYPDPAGNNTGPRQKETLAFMDFADKHHFVMGANFHGGAEVFNYPWDCWYKLTADNNWWNYTGRQYADTVHKYSYAGYFTYLNNGVTNGAAWYQIFGGRQDYMNYFYQCREVTIELSDTFILPAYKLVNLWNYNYHSLLNYLESVNYGFQGIVSDTVTGEPLLTEIFILNHDKDSSWVYSKLPSGFYARPVYQGDYEVTFSSLGYFSKTINVNVSNLETTTLNVQLRPITYGIQTGLARVTMVFPNPNRGQFKVILPEQGIDHINLAVTDLLGNVIIKKPISLSSGQDYLTIDMSGHSLGLYILKIDTGKKIYVDKVTIQ